MILTVAPDLPLVIGLPFLLLLLGCVVTIGLWVFLGRMTRS
jgi:hypothetical protein